MVISDGQAVFTEAIEMMTSCARQALTKAHVNLEQITRFIPHQANQRMMDKVCKRLGLDRGILASTISEHANSSAATIPFYIVIQLRRKAADARRNASDDGRRRRIDGRRGRLALLEIYMAALRLLPCQSPGNTRVYAL